MAYSLPKRANMSWPNGVGENWWFSVLTVPVVGVAKLESRKYHSPMLSPVAPAAVGHPQTHVGRAVAVHVGGDRPGANADESELACRVDGRIHLSVTVGPQVEEELVDRIGLVGRQIDFAVAVEVADDRIPPQRAVDDRIDLVVVVGVKIPLRAGEQAHLVAVGGVAVEVAGDRHGR